ALLEAGLLGASRSEILQNATALAPILAAKGVDPEQARVLLASAAEILSGEATRSEVVRELVGRALEEAWPSIVERLRGLLVEKELNGFIILYVPAAGEDPISSLTKLRDAIRDALDRSGYTGAKVLRGGTEFMTYEMREAAIRDVKRSDRMSMVFVIIVMAIVLESIAAVFLPFIGIGFGIMTSLAIAYFLAKTGVIDVTTHSRTIMYATGLGLGIDYAVYVSKSFREAASKGLDSRSAAAEAFRRSLRPVIAGATTAMIGFGSMLLAGEFSFISSIGATVPLTILMVMLASITFIPALLAYVGETRWFWWPRNPYEAQQKREAKPRAGAAVIKLSGVLLVVSILLGAASYAVVAGYQGSYDLSLNLPEDTESYAFLKLFNKYYDPGVLYPVYIIASSHEKAEEINKTVSSLDCVSRSRVDEALDGRVVFVYMKVNPMSYEGVSCASKIREAAHSVDAESLVGGFSAANLDLKQEITNVFYHKVYPVAITLMFLTMLAAYGGVVTAIGAVLSVVFAAYLGSALTILYYEYVKGLPVLWYLPVITFTAVLGVGMDYNSFYLARAREECGKECSRDAVARSISRGTPLVLGLSIIMASAYLGLALSKTPGMASMGLALMLGVLGAGLLSSTLLTPPLIALLGRWAWWPRRPGERAVER
ncbi:MAG: MMPL family transporter, partial [Desulfurococcales archaeon]|nr:MMPL family transporter [Desulfurococcales archaeon]